MVAQLCHHKSPLLPPVPIHTAHGEGGPLHCGSYVQPRNLSPLEARWSSTGKTLQEPQGGGLPWQLHTQSPGPSQDLWSVPRLPHGRACFPVLQKPSSGWQVKLHPAVVSVGQNQSCQKNGGWQGPAGKDASLPVGLWDGQEYGWKRMSRAHAEHFPNMLGRVSFYPPPNLTSCRKRSTQLVFSK